MALLTEKFPGLLRNGPKTEKEGPKKRLVINITKDILYHHFRQISLIKDDDHQNPSHLSLNNQLPVHLFKKITNIIIIYFTTTTEELRGSKMWIFLSLLDVTSKEPSPFQQRL